MVTKSKTIVLYDGTKKRIFARADSEKEALKKLSDMEAGQCVINEKVSLATWAEEWLETYLKPTVNGEAYTMYEAILRLHILPKLGNLPLAGLRPIQLQRCINDIEDMSSSLISKARIVLNGLFRDARLNRLIVDNPIEGLKWPKGYANERRALTPEEREIFMKVVPKHHKGAMFGLMLGCGLRPGEVRALRWMDIKDGHVYVQHAIKKDGNVMGAPKSKAGVRVIPIPPWLQNMLSEMSKSSMFLFPDRNGSYITSRMQRKSWDSFKRLMLMEAGVPTFRNQIVKEAAKENSLYDVTMYFLRHTYATILIENGMDIRTVQYLMGHSNINVTSKIYTHITDAVVTAARDKIDLIDFSGVPNVTNARQVIPFPSVKAE